ncbi:MAG: hypothetical protein NC213_09170 [Acetobacter sp.]|nr:hypothetical protein [Bacteroides sp.]MCM1341900.1 hypothetical protein [Acetobacter sp.]MCM1434084.1 hypothetical protein [Clostridiales bacterium]
MKKFIASCLCIVTLFSATITAYASSIQPYSNNVNTTDVTFSISSSGKATVYYSYVGKSGTTKKAEIVTKVQKKVGLIWITVDSGNWTDTSTLTSFSKSHSVQLSSKGTYRAHVVFTISGTGGSDDKITKNVEKTYS